LIALLGWGRIIDGGKKRENSNQKTTLISEMLANDLKNLSSMSMRDYGDWYPHVKAEALHRVVLGGWG
jgi:hypothetical protein